VSTSKVLAILLAEWNAPNREIVAEQRHLVLDERQGCIGKRGRRRDDCSTDRASPCRPNYAVTEVANPIGKIVYGTILEVIREEVQTPRERGWALKAERPECRVLAAIVEIDVSILHDDGAAFRLLDNSEDLFERVRMTATVLLD
jgi:hypothetical protein